MWLNQMSFSISSPSNTCDSLGPGAASGESLKVVVILWTDNAAKHVEDVSTARIIGQIPAAIKSFPSEMFTTKKCRCHMLRDARWQVEALAPPALWKTLPYQFRTRHQVLGEVQKSRSGVLLVYLGVVIFQFHSMVVDLFSISIS